MRKTELGGTKKETSKTYPGLADFPVSVGWFGVQV